MAFNYDKGRRMVDLEWSDQNIYDYFEGRDFFFPKEILTRYFLSLKTKAFVVLTGISGTGKTKIAQVFADYMCQEETDERRQKRIAFVSVRPDWMDNKGLLGYYNLLDEKYHTTPVLNLLIDAEKNPDKPYFVILDEMNLAKVEQYFSDFLSIMESRTPGNGRGEPLCLHSGKMAETHAGDQIPPVLHIAPNVYFTGTVNVDESTYMFSPKVLDRANVIEFNDVDLENYSRGFEQSERFVLEDPDVRMKLLVKGDIPFCSRDDYASARQILGDKGTLLQEILTILHPHNLHFGYRVVNEVSRFIVKAKEMVKDPGADDTLDIQILQKILPKFHGSQARLGEPLQSLLTFCYRNAPSNDVSLDAEALEKAIEAGDFRFPRSARKLSRMLRNLKAQGYTSFIE
jgi:5-methylcytosine-specific restriction enzyme B